MSACWRQWSRTVAMAVALGGTLTLQPPAEAAVAYLLDKAAAIDNGNAHKVPLDDALMWSAHNSFNPNEWTNLSEVLNSGVRVLELDFYLSGHTPRALTASNRVDYRLKEVSPSPVPGGPPVVSYTDIDAYAVRDDILSRVMQGIPIDRFRYEVIEYSNNCETHPASPLLSGFGGSLANCLAEIKA